MPVPLLEVDDTRRRDDIRYRIVTTLRVPLTFHLGHSLENVDALKRPLTYDLILQSILTPAKGILLYLSVLTTFIIAFISSVGLKVFQLQSPHPLTVLTVKDYVVYRIFLYSNSL